ncbi:hypothetical protein IFM89_033251 [Coptis chinensis]|uniref:Uncharacterized protein n=1 Tax=Coptis chinensis TaxID=261450 RepID=A0A835J1X4_9MAGN|nr:hypothetical protein IFM89_033251 [Coptis chinensis]
MKGTLSPLLGELQFLEALVIGGMKQIGGSIPETLSKQVHLTQLVLEENILEGSIPSSLGSLGGWAAALRNDTGEVIPANNGSLVELRAVAHGMGMALRHGSKEIIV